MTWTVMRRSIDVRRRRRRRRTNGFHPVGHDDTVDDDAHGYTNDEASEYYYTYVTMRKSELEKNVHMQRGMLQLPDDSLSFSSSSTKH